MTDEKTTLKQATDSDSDAFTSALETSISNQTVLSGATDGGVVATSTTQSTSSTSEINQGTSTSIDVFESSGESVYTLAVSHMIGKSSEYEPEPIEVDTAALLVLPRERDGFLPIPTVPLEAQVISSTNEPSQRPGTFTTVIESSGESYFSIVSDVVVNVTEHNPKTAEVDSRSVLMVPTTSLTDVQQTAGTSKVIIESSGESSYTSAVSHFPQPIEDDPTVPLIPPRYRDDFPPIAAVSYTEYEPQPPPRPSLIQFMCCCFTSTYGLYYARKIRNSKCMIVVLIGLLAIPILLLYFGFSYVGHCPMYRSSPLLLIFSGAFGLIFIAIHIVIKFSGGGDSSNLELCKLVAVLGFLIYSPFLVLEVFGFYTQTPVFDNSKDASFCEKVYYDFVYYMNYVALIVAILALLLHIPTKPYIAVEVVPREYFDVN